MTQKEVADHCGLGSKTIWNWTKDAVLGPKIEAFKSRIETARELCKRDGQAKAVEIAKRTIESVHDELEELKATAVDAFRRAITSPDEKTALAAFKEYMDRTEGKAVQRNINENSGNVTIDHVYHLPEGFAEAMLGDAYRLGLAPAPADVVEAEVVESE